MPFIDDAEYAQYQQWKGGGAAAQPAASPGPGSPYMRNSLAGGMQNAGGMIQQASSAYQTPGPDAAIPAAGQTDVAQMEAANGAYAQPAQPAQQAAAPAQGGQGMFGSMGSFMNRAIGGAREQQMQQQAAAPGAPAQQQAAAPGGAGGMYGTAMRANALRRAISPWSNSPPPTSNRLASAPSAAQQPGDVGAPAQQQAAAPGGANAAASAMRKAALTRAVGRVF